MNKPPTIKRFDHEKWHNLFWEKAQDKDGSFSYGLTEPRAAAIFASFVTNFTELEHRMEALAAKLMGTDPDVASIAMRSVVSIQARIGLLESVLTRARRNHDLPPAFDEAIREFQSLKKIRNDYVHGRWRTYDDGQIWVVKVGGDPLIMDDIAAERFDSNVLLAALKRIGPLVWKVGELTAFQPPPEEPLSQALEQVPDQDGQTPST